MQSAVSDRHLALVHDPDWALTAGAPADSAQAAFDAEAIRDHYGIVWDGLVVDFEGSLYLEKDTPPPLLRGPSCTISTIMK